ncbi:MAG: VOC family protein [Steroidobacteraceae bacterium]
MPNSHGSFIWYELMTTDANAAAKFYGSVIGWKIADHAQPQPGVQDYRMIGRDDGGFAGGVFKLNKDMTDHGARPAWLGYLHVTGLDAAVKAIEADGGRTLMPRKDLPVGSIALVADPMGTPFYVMDPIPPPGKPDAKSDVFDPNAAQRIRWNELASPDLDRAKRFYSRHFGFEFKESMPMGPGGDYCFIDHGGRRLGAIMQKQANGFGSGWMFYFGVKSIAQAKSAIESGGGKVLHGPLEVPGGDWIVIASDPQGAAFGVVGSKGA